MRDQLKAGSLAISFEAILVRRPCAHIKTYGLARRRGVAAGAGRDAGGTRRRTILTAVASQPPGSSSPSAIWIRGGDGAPERARRYVRSQLDRELPGAQQGDAALIVSELVTNSVRHAEVGSHGSLFLELTTLSDRVRIAVIDPGSGPEPRLLPADPVSTGGFGLRLVDQLSLAWGVVREAAGTTRVWCEVPLDRARPVSAH